MPKPYKTHKFMAADYETSGHTATYSPEDNKLRLYFAHRVSHDEWHTLTQGYGFKWTMKQGSDMSATWTPARAELCKIIAAGYIGDEQYGPAERAADRAERFAKYEANRERDANEFADRYDAAEGSEGQQNQDKAERAATRRDKLLKKSLDQWATADYWNARRAGVIRHALYRMQPSVRARRIENLQADERRLAKEYPEREPIESEWQHHFRMRIAYEQAMLESELGGVLACDLELMERGGMWGGLIIRSVSKNKTSGKYRSVTVHNQGKIEKITFHDTLLGDKYTEPTAETIKQEAKLWRAHQKAAKAAKAPTIKLINPTLEDAQRLQKHLAATVKQAVGDVNPEPLQCTQAQYSANSKGAYARLETKSLCAGGEFHSTGWGHNVQPEVVVKIRASHNRVVVITDKPQKPLPDSVWSNPRQDARDKIKEDPELQGIIYNAANRYWLSDLDEATCSALRLAELAGYYRQRSQSQFGLTEAGRENIKPGVQVSN